MEYEEPKQRVRRPDPVTKYDFCVIIASMLKRPVGYVLGRTKGWPIEWYHQIQSECKQIKDPVAKVKFINWFIKEAKLKETNLTQI